jgi:hypothetical protein
MITVHFCYNIKLGHCLLQNIHSSYGFRPYMLVLALYIDGLREPSLVALDLRFLILDLDNL